MVNLEAEELNGSCLTAIPGLMLYHSERTDIGCCRKKNEDAMGFYCTEEPNFTCLLIVADGVGGNVAGEVASRLAEETVGERFFEHGDPSDPSRALEDALTAANRAIFDRAATDPMLAGMATTCTAAVIRGQELWLGHVGDCRVYLAGDGELRQLTADHSVAAEYERQGKTVPPEKQALANVLTRWLGAGQEVEVDTGEAIPLSPDHTLLLCSDGLTKMLGPNEIQDILETDMPANACHQLVDLARQRGGPDNITVLLARQTMV